jgi:hypothetical protein
MLRMAAGTAANLVGAGSAGKGLGWNQTELLALARAAPVVLQSPTIGANQNASDLGRRILAEFLLYESCPSVTECTRSKKSNLDLRRWHGRSALATLQCCIRRIKAPLVMLHPVCRRIHVAELTGGPYSDESMRRLATAILTPRMVTVDSFFLMRTILLVARTTSSAPRSQFQPRSTSSPRRPTYSPTAWKS